VTPRPHPPPHAAEGRVGAQRSRQRLYLVTPRLDDTASFTRDVDAALEAADIAAVLLRLAESDERTLISRAKVIASIVQGRDVALLLDGHSHIVARADADGAHLGDIESFTAALASLKPDRIAGAGGLHSRHDAMVAAEAGADYVMFGEPDRQDRRPPFDELQERLAWSAELLQLPCIGYAANLDEVAPLARTGADFVALGEWIWTHPQGVTVAVAAAAKNLGEPVPR
jgi:thiamine-phosphate pyrophosphorylase